MQEILTLKPPFYGTDEVAVISTIANGNLPERPSKDDCAADDLDFLWEICTQCWKKQPLTRPTATEAFRLLSMPRTFAMFLKESLRKNPDHAPPPLQVRTLDATSRMELGQLHIHDSSADLFDGSFKENGSNTNELYDRPKRVAVMLFHASSHGDNGDKSGVST